MTGNALQISALSQRDDRPADARSTVDHLFLGFLLMAGIWQCLFVYRNIIHARDPYVYGDWVINYAQGFVRRGLSGEIALRLGKLLAVEPVSLVFVAVIALSLASLLACYFLLRSRLSMVQLAILFTPAGLLFGFGNAGNVGRKDVLALALTLLAAHLLITRCNSAQGLTRATIAIVGASVGIVFVHEAVVFYLAPLWVLTLLAFGKIGAWRRGSLVLAAAAVVVALAFLIVLSSTRVTPEAIAAMCTRLGGSAPAQCTNGDGAWLAATGLCLHDPNCPRRDKRWTISADLFGRLGAELCVHWVADA